MIPAFSFAIYSSVFPNTCIWSYPIVVIIDINGDSIILVESNLPPKPVSHDTYLIPLSL